MVKKELLLHRVFKPFFHYHSSHLHPNVSQSAPSSPNTQKKVNLVKLNFDWSSWNFFPRLLCFKIRFFALLLAEDDEDEDKMKRNLRCFCFCLCEVINQVICGVFFFQIYFLHLGPKRSHGWIVIKYDERCFDVKNWKEKLLFELETFFLPWNVISTTSSLSTTQKRIKKLLTIYSTMYWPK